MVRDITRATMPAKKTLFVIFIGLFLTACQTSDPMVPPALEANPSRQVSPTARINTPTPPPPTSTLPAPTATQTPIPPTETHSPTPTIGPKPGWLIPDSEIVYAPSAIGFSVQDFLAPIDGFLSTYRQYLMITGWISGADMVSLVAEENSINPRILLALLEYQSGCVFDRVENPDHFDTAMGASQAHRLDMYGQLVWAVHVLSEGYYGWRLGTLTEFSLSDGTIIKPKPDLNAGTVALKYFFSQVYSSDDYHLAVNPEMGFPTFYEEMFGNPWERAIVVEPLVPKGVEQPPMTLPFEAGKAWALTGGPHPAFESNGPMASLDFAPPTAVTGCYQSEDWVIAMADGLVVRSALGQVVQDLDGDGNEQTGWVLLYLHIEDRHRVPEGTYLQAGEHIGHPSCEGGRATGTHVHIARKYNGEWIPAGGMIPFVLDGWTAHEGGEPYQGSLTRGDDVVVAHLYASYISRIARDD